MFNNTTWTCHMCNKERQDQDINVYTYYLKDIPNAERNLRYCNDNPECLEKAREKGKTGKL